MRNLIKISKLSLTDNQKNSIFDLVSDKMGFGGLVVAASSDVDWDKKVSEDNIKDVASSLKNVAESYEKQKLKKIEKEHTPKDQDADTAIDSLQKELSDVKKTLDNMSNKNTNEKLVETVIELVSELLHATPNSNKKEASNFNTEETATLYISAAKELIASKWTPTKTKNKKGLPGWKNKDTGNIVYQESEPESEDAPFKIIPPKEQKMPEPIDRPAPSWHDSKNPIDPKNSEMLEEKGFTKVEPDYNFKKDTVLFNPKTNKSYLFGDLPSSMQDKLKNQAKGGKLYKGPESKDEEVVKEKGDVDINELAKDYGVENPEENADALIEKIQKNISKAKEKGNEDEASVFQEDLEKVQRHFGEPEDKPQEESKGPEQQETIPESVEDSKEETIPESVEDSKEENQEPHSKKERRKELESRPELNLVKIQAQAGGYAKELDERINNLTEKDLAKIDEIKSESLMPNGQLNGRDYYEKIKEYFELDGSAPKPKINKNKKEEIKKSLDSVDKNQKATEQHEDALHAVSEITKEDVGQVNRRLKESLGILMDGNADIKKLIDSGMTVRDLYNKILTNPVIVKPKNKAANVASRVASAFLTAEENKEIELTEDQKKKLVDKVKEKHNGKDVSNLVIAKIVREAKRGQQTKRKDKDLMSDTGGSNYYKKEPKIKPPREDLKKTYRTKNKQPDSYDKDVDQDPDLKTSHIVDRIVKGELRWKKEG